MYQKKYRKTPSFLAYALIALFFVFPPHAFASDLAVHYKLLDLKAHGPVSTGTVDIQVFNRSAEDLTAVELSIDGLPGVSLEKATLQLGDIDGGQVASISSSISIAQHVFDGGHPIGWKVISGSATTNVVGIELD